MKGAAVIVLALLGLPLPASANHGVYCEGEAGQPRPEGCLCPQYSRVVVVEAPNPGNHGASTDRYYVVVDEAASNGSILIAFVYQESNGRAGLQRHDDYCTDDVSYTDDDRDEILF